MPLESIEVSGRTIEEAVETAARELGVSTEDIDYEIVEEGSKGFLGLGQNPSVIKATLKEGVEPGPRPAPTPAPEPVAEAEEPEEIEPEPTMAEVFEKAPARGDDFTGLVVSILADVLKAMDLDARPVVRSDDEEELVVELVGKDLAILIGTRGQTLDALQYLVGIGANKGGVGRRRVILDAEGYRQRHMEMLERRAHDYARAVKEQGEEAVLEPQPARDRRIIHLALKDDPDVYTYSEGDGEDRHVVISPKK